MMHDDGSMLIAAEEQAEAYRLSHEFVRWAAANPMIQRLVNRERKKLPPMTGEEFLHRAGCPHGYGDRDTCHVCSPPMEAP